MAIDWVKLALIKSGMPDKALRNYVGAVGLYNQNDILNEPFRRPATPEAQGRGSLEWNDNNPENSENEILRRSDGTYVYWLHGENEDGNACRLCWKAVGKWKMDFLLCGYA